MAQPIDLDAYLKRIGFRGAPSADLETLTQLHALHTHAIPFSGLSPFIGEEVKLDTDSLQDKIVRSGRGGYCFEQNVLFWRVLQAIGFRVTGLSGRVRLNFPEDLMTPLGHMLLLVSLPEGRYIADVGFGGLTVTAPLRLEAGIEQRTSHEPARLLESDGTYSVQLKLGAEWKTLYIFGLRESIMADYEMFSWYFATHRDSPFVSMLILARPEPGRRHALRSTRYSVHHLDGRSETRHLSSVEELRKVVQENFHLPLPDSPVMDQKLAKLIAAPR
jgi:N-hydroxyarylamine O-acetyltransferase